MTQWGDKWGSKWGCSTFELIESSLVDICTAWLWWQHDRHYNIRSICEVMAELFGRVDIKLQQAIMQRGVDNATTDLLDDLGAMVGVPRQGLSDDLYRRAIKARARSSIGRGRLGDFIAVADLLIPDQTTRFASPGPKCVQIFFSGVTDEERRIFLRMMVEVPALVTCLEFIEIDPDGVFEFSYDNGGGDLDPVELHWGHTDGDINPNETAGMAYQVVI